MPETVGIHRSIRSRIKTRLIDQHPEIEWIFRGESNRTPGLQQSHVIIDIVTGRSWLAGSGNPRLHRTVGALVFRIATPLTDLWGPNEAIADLITPHFRALLDTDVTPAIRYGVPSWSPSEVPEETWNIGRVRVEWQSDFYEPVS